LVRSGVRKLKFIDFDQVTLSSLNRNALAVREDVGIPKVVAMKNRLKQINSQLDIEVSRTSIDNYINNLLLLLTHQEVVEFFSYKVADKLIMNRDGSVPAFVLDCIDNIDTKVDLLRYCKGNIIDSYPVIEDLIQE